MFLNTSTLMWMLPWLQIVLNELWIIMSEELRCTTYHTPPSKTAYLPCYCNGEMLACHGGMILYLCICDILTHHYSWFIQDFP
jgi:hypothetical protein